MQTEEGDFCRHPCTLWGSESREQFICLFFGRAASWLLPWLSLVAASGRLLSSCGARGFSLQWLLLWQSTDRSCSGFSSCGARAQYLRLPGFRAQAQELWCTGLVAPQQLSGIFLDQGSNPCLLHWQADSIS